MTRNCSACDHPKRREIDAALVAGRSARDIAAAHGLNYQAIRRHRLNHLPETIRAAALAALDSAPVAQTAIEAQTPATPAHGLPEAVPASAPAIAPETAPAPVRPRQRTRALQLTDSPPAPPASPVSQLSTGQAAPAPAASDVFNLYASATDLRERAMAILAAAERDRDAKTALLAIREGRGILDHLSRLEERQGGNAAAIPLAESPEWHRTRAAIISALADHPEARLAIAEALIRVGALN